MKVAVGKHSQETRDKISKTRLERKIRHTQETKDLLSRLKKGKQPWLGRKHSIETKLKMSLNRKGKKQSPEHAAKNRITMLGKHLSEEAKDKLRKANLGPLNPNWNNGSSFEEYGRNWTDELRDSIRSRDNYVCIMCGLHQDELQGRVKKHDVHHIDYNKYNLNPTNLITLCKKCHVKTNYNREYRIEYFNDLLFI